MSNPTSHRLADDVYATTCCGGDVVFLALQADRYLCLAAGARRLSLAADRSRLTAPDPELLAELREMALLDDGGAGVARELPPALPRRDLDDGPDAPLRTSDLFAGLRCVLDVLINYRGRSLAALVAMAGREARPEVGFSTELAAEVRRYRRIARWLPLPRKCLLQSFVLLRHLRRRGLDARWVFAARTWPFEAHCWLQVEDVALDDRYERLVAYAPVMVV